MYTWLDLISPLVCLEPNYAFKGPYYKGPKYGLTNTSITKA